MSGTISKPHELSSEWRRRCCGVRLSAGAVKVCWAMYFGAVHGVSYSSQERLAQETGLDRTDVGKILRAMAAAGLIQAVSDDVLTDALKQDGEPRGDKRLVGYRRVIDPGIALSKELAAAVVFGRPMDPATKIRISKRNEGSSAEYLRSKRGDHVTLKSDQGNEGDVALNTTPRVEPSEERDTPQFEGTVVREVEGTVVPPYEPLDSDEADAERVRISPLESVDRLGTSVAKNYVPPDQAGAPDGASPFVDRILAVYPFVVPPGDAWRTELERSASILGEASILQGAAGLAAPSATGKRKALLPWLAVGLELHEARRLARCIWGMAYPDGTIKALIRDGSGSRLCGLLRTLAYATESGREDVPSNPADWLIDRLQRDVEHAA